MEETINNETTSEVTDEVKMLNVEENIKEVQPDGPTIDAVILPTSIYSDIVKSLNIINDIDGDKFKDEYDEKDKLAIGISADGVRTSVKNNFLVKTLRDKEAKWEQEPKYADKVLSIRELSISSKATGNIKGSAATAKFYNHLGLGGMIQTPLWHSGFWITLKTIKESDLLNLEMSLTNNQITLGRETNTLIFSNYSVIFNRIITEFIIGHIQSCSLDIKDLNELSKYIKIQDLYPLVLGLIQTMYVKGFKDVRTCINSLNIDPSTSKPKCSYTLESIIDPKKLLWINRKELTTEHFKIMAKRGPATVTIDEVKEYQSTLDVNKNKKINIPTENGIDVILEIKAPSLESHIINGEKWVNNIIGITEKLFTEKLTKDEKNRRINTSSKMVLLGIYNHFIESIGLSDGTIVDDRDTIDELLELFVTDKVAYKAIIKAVKEYVDSNTLAVVAIPNYKCPNCEAEQTDNKLTKEFKDLIPINVLESFFDLSILKTNKVSERNLDEDI